MTGRNNSRRLNCAGHLSRRMRESWRYVSSQTDEAASLFFSSGTDWTEFTDADGNKDWKMERKDKGADIVLVASEPLTFERGEHARKFSVDSTC